MRRDRHSTEAFLSKKLPGGVSKPSRAGTVVEQTHGCFRHLTRVQPRASRPRWNGSRSRVAADSSLGRGCRRGGTYAVTHLYGFAARSQTGVVLRSVASTLRWESSAGKSSFTLRGKIADVLFLSEKLAENQAFCSHATNN